MRVYGTGSEDLDEARWNNKDADSTFNNERKE